MMAAEGGHQKPTVRTVYTGLALFSYGRKFRGEGSNSDFGCARVEGLIGPSTTLAKPLHTPGWVEATWSMAWKAGSTRET